MIEPLIADVDGLLGIVRRGRSVNINSQATKARAIALASKYFSEDRPKVAAELGDSGELLATDALWQDVVRLAHGNNARASYVTKLRGLKRRLSSLSVTLLTAAAGPSDLGDEPAPGSDEALLLATLHGLVPTAADSYRQGLIDLNSTDRVSYRGTAAEFREALREILDHLAPDDAVVKQEGFRLEAGLTKPTMKQKVTFVLKSRGLSKSQRETTEKSVSLVEELVGEFARAVYTRAAVATHVADTRDEVHRIKRFVDTALFDLLEIRVP